MLTILIDPSGERRSIILVQDLERFLLSLSALKPGSVVPTRRLDKNGIRSACGRNLSPPRRTLLDTTTSKSKNSK
jgi:hypothetical protein